MNAPKKLDRRREKPMRALTRIVPSLFPLVALTIALLALPPDGIAQLGKAMWSFPKLSSTDLAMIRKIVREDFTTSPKGTMKSWNNPESTNSGTVTLLDRFTSIGRDCRRVQYFIKPGPKQPNNVIQGSYVMTSCHMPDGSWKIDDSARPG